MTITIQWKLALALVCVVMMTSLWQPVSSHGRLIKPPARSSMWRFGYPTPTNYDDNQMFCGGSHFLQSKGGKCGVCGDPYDGPGAGATEVGSKYAQGIVVATYKKGQDIDITVQLTANHKGYFEFRLCPTNNKNVEATKECLDKNLLEMADGSGTKFQNVGQYGASDVKLKVKLPSHLTCDLCMLQWRYHTGNSWGVQNGAGCVGCGHQEEFYGCADVKITN